MNEKRTNIQNRTQKYLLETALDLLKQGFFPTVNDVAKEAEISRATAYRYFPTQSSLIEAIVDICLQPTIDWQPTSALPLERMREFLHFAYPHLEQNEAALRAALSLSLQQWANPKEEKPLIRGHRKDVLARITEPLKNELSEETYQKVLYAYSLIYGSEVFMVLKDIWHLELDEIIDVAEWISEAVLEKAKQE